jgi:predicted AlkP superfamily pyrophosphatase or phosphodiesterase
MRFTIFPSINQSGSYHNMAQKLKSLIRMPKHYFRLTAAFLISAVLISCSKSEVNNSNEADTNSIESMEKPYLILISLDGFRWDYVEKYNPPNLVRFIENGVKAESLISSFPSKTFPNHYTLVTGLYPDKHGIIGNKFYNYEKEVTYSMGNRSMVEDGTFYGGSPLWVQAHKANMVSASYFFVGTEADIQGVHPNYYYNYDGKVTNEDRVDQAIKWLEMPEKNRPHLITLYFSDMDNVGHKYGPGNDEEIKTVLFELDKVLGDLFDRTAETKLPVNIIIVSDHGMANVPVPNLLAIDDLKNESLYTLIDNGALLNIHPKQGIAVDSVFNYLKSKEDHFKVYMTKEAAGFEYVPESKDWGSIQVIPDFGYYFYWQSRIESLVNHSVDVVGVHGYDPKHREMHGIFYGNGSAFKSGYETTSVKNVHVYPLACIILGLEIPDNIDGKLNELEGVLK